MKVFGIKGVCRLKALCFRVVVVVVVIKIESHTQPRTAWKVQFPAPHDPGMPTLPCSLSIREMEAQKFNILHGPCLVSDVESISV